MARSFFLSKLWQNILLRIGVLETYQGTIPPPEDYNTVADVRAETSHTDGDRIFCLENQIIYIFDDASMAADNGSLVLKPDDIGSGSPGRWVMEQQLALKNHSHFDKADKITDPLQTKFLVADSEGNPVESVYHHNSFAAIDHTHTGYASVQDLTDLQVDVGALTEALTDKADKYNVQEGDIGKPAVFDSDGNVIPGNTIQFYEFTSGALQAGVTKSVAHNKDLAVGYIINVRSSDNETNAQVAVLKPTPGNAHNSVDIQSSIAVSAPGLIIQILGA